MSNNGNSSGIEAEAVQAEGRSSQHFSLQPEHLQPMLPYRI